MHLVRNQVITFTATTVAPPPGGDPNRVGDVSPMTPDTSRLTDESIGIIVGVLVSAFLFVIVIVIIVVVRRRRRTCRYSRQFRDHPRREAAAMSNRDIQAFTHDAAHAKRICLCAVYK